MANNQENCKKLLERLDENNLKSIAVDIVRKREKKDAIEIILRYSKNPEEFLRHRFVTCDIIKEYLSTSGITVPLKRKKEDYIQSVLQHLKTNPTQVGGKFTCRGNVHCHNGKLTLQVASALDMQNKEGACAGPQNEEGTGAEPQVKLEDLEAGVMNMNLDDLGTGHDPLQRPQNIKFCFEVELPKGSTVNYLKNADK
ncbi:uncharacterized protein O3C94_000915 [Discoglossus pictus]